MRVCIVDALVSPIDSLICFGIITFTVFYFIFHIINFLLVDE